MMIPRLSARSPIIICILMLVLAVAVGGILWATRDTIAVTVNGMQGEGRGQNEKCRKENMTLQVENSNEINIRGKNNYSCLLVISTSQQNIGFVQKQFESYQNDNTEGQVDILINIYNSPEPSNSTAALGGNENRRGRSNSSSASTTSNITFSHFPGLKPKLWKNIDSKLVTKYEHVWFLDDDMIFDKNHFAFDQFMVQVKLNDAVISAPKIVARDKDKHRGLKSGDQFGSEAAGEIVDFIEINSFMFKTKAWIWFQENFVIDTPKSDWGPDCFWCKLFKYESENRCNQFGKVACFRSLLYYIVHTDSKTHPRAWYTRKHRPNEIACEKYKNMLKEKYKRKVKFICHQKEAQKVPMELEEMHHRTKRL